MEIKAITTRSEAEAFEADKKKEGYCTRIQKRQTVVDDKVASTVFLVYYGTVEELTACKLLPV